MSPQPFDPSELGLDDHELDDVAAALERYATGSEQVAPPGLVGRVTAAIDSEPVPRRGWLARLGGGWAGRSGTRAMGILTLAAAAVLIAVAAGGVIDLARRTNVGATPPPVVSPSMPSPSLAPSPSSVATPSSSASGDASQTASPSPSPSATASGTEDDDNSGPGGGGGGDNSGPGGGGDDSGPVSSDSGGSGGD
jgi:hypothetical protein